MLLTGHAWQYPFQDDEGVWEYNGICVDAPFGSGDCPDDSNPPNFLHVPEEVNSGDALQRVLQSVDHWMSMIREDSIRHFIVITDDDSWIRAGYFMDSMAELDPPLDDLIFHAIAASMGPIPACEMDPPHSCCWYAAHQGKVYKKLVERTGGHFADLCEQDFEGVFDELALIVAEGGPLACEWDLPEAPAGTGLEHANVSVDFIDDSKGRHRLCQVESQGDCDGERHAWYYDDNENPGAVAVCPYTCERIRQGLPAKIDIKFGCYALDGGPE